MNPIKQIAGTVNKVRDLSPTAREYTIRPDNPFPFVAGTFVNLFVTHEGEVIRRAFSISSNDDNNLEFTLSIRLSPDGKLTPIMWSKNMIGEKVKIMGPLGLNTVDRIQSNKIFLFGFGIGAGVVKSLAEHIVNNRQELESLTIVTGNRSASEILHKDFFDNLAEKNEKVSVKYVVSDKKEPHGHPTGYIQEHINTYDFNDSDIYICGQSIACVDLEEKIKLTKPRNSHFLIEDFH